VTAKSDVKAAVSPVARATRRFDTRALSEGQETVNGGGDGDGAAGLRSTRNRQSDVGDGEQPEVDEKQAGRRSLRSTDTGARCKSELAQYFHSYEQIISLEDPEPGKLGMIMSVLGHD
jgi:hypothetical protein